MLATHSGDTIGPKHIKDGVLWSICEMLYIENWMVYGIGSYILNHHQVKVCKDTMDMFTYGPAITQLQTTQCIQEKSLL